MAIPGIGLLKGMKVTLKTLFTKPVTVNYHPHYEGRFSKANDRETPVPRARGVIALDQDACTVCMLCARSCPDWCIYIEGHKEEKQPDKPGGRVRVRATLDRFDIDYALCMYCGICVEVCPFDALFWSPEYEYSENQMGGMLHDMDRLQGWLAVVPPAPELEN